MPGWLSGLNVKSRHLHALRHKASADFKAGHASMVFCRKCVEMRCDGNEKLKQDGNRNKDRAKLVQKMLSMPDAWRCACFLPIHSETCQLAPRAPGERRWPGKSKWISEKEVAADQILRKTWKR